MQFPAFFKCLAERQPKPRVELNLLRELVDIHHSGVGHIKFKYFPDFDGAELGGFIWLEDERTSPHEDPFNDALVFINDRYKDNRPWRRLVAAKELMHVFDGPGQQVPDEKTFRALLADIQANPVVADWTEAYAADRGALWKATITLVPPWLRDEFLPAWKAGSVKPPELAARWWLPEGVVTMAMGEYYERQIERLLP